MSYGIIYPRFLSKGYRYLLRPIAGFKVGRVERLHLHLRRGDQATKSHHCGRVAEMFRAHRSLILNTSSPITNTPCIRELVSWAIFTIRGFEVFSIRGKGWCGTWSPVTGEDFWACLVAYPPRILHRLTTF